MIAQIAIRKILKRHTIRIFLLSNYDWCTSILISGRINSFRRQQHQSQGSIDRLKRITNTIDQVLFLIDQRSYQLCCINVTATHLQEMCMSRIKNILNDLIHIIDLTYRCNCIRSMMRTHDQRLWLIIRNTANSHISFHFLHIFVKLCTKWGVLDIMDRTIESILSVYC